jgi:hypothetical protein
LEAKKGDDVKRSEHATQLPWLKGHSDTLALRGKRGICATVKREGGKTNQCASIFIDLMDKLKKFSSGGF